MQSIGLSFYHSPFSPLKENRSSPSCGNKHDNLVKMMEFLEQHPQEGVTIPAPYGIPTEMVVAHLRIHGPRFFDYWRELSTIYGEGHLHFFQDFRVLDLISKTQAEIKSAFEKFVLPDDMQSWVSLKKHYMVRSSGSEDGEKSANAGGNLTCSYVPANEIPTRIGDVVASYIDKQSLSNRIRSGENPFLAPLSLSVTVQKVKGETIGGEKNPAKIPVSVVLFTNEPLYVGKESFRIMKVSAAYGHGEGVVGNCGIATDIAFILQSRTNSEEIYLWYEQQEKRERLAPLRTSNGIQLEPIENPSELIHKHAIDDAMIKRLFALGKQMELFFDGPTDMELVIKEGTIFIVQARPINRSLSVPTFLNLEQVCLQHSSTGKVLVPGTSSALILTHEEVLFEERLETATCSLQPHHKLVLVEEDEPLNSHPIIRMTEWAIPCIYLGNAYKSLFNALQENRSLSLAVCIQQGTIGIVEDPSNIVIQEGYINHPIPLSCQADPIDWRKHNRIIPPKVYSLLKKIRITQSSAVAMRALAKLSAQPILQNTQITYAPLLPIAQDIQARVHTTIRELGHSLQQGERLEVLFYAKALETLIWGEGYSIVRLQELSETLSSYAARLNGKLPALAQESLIEPLMAETQEAWVNFLTAIEEHPPADIEDLKKLIHSIGEGRTFWLTFFFDAARKQTTNSKELLAALLQGFDDFSQKFVQDLRKLEKKVDGFKITLFSEVNTQQLAFDQLLAIIHHFETAEFLESFKKSSPLAKILATQVLEKAVDLYDRSIKSVKTSSRPIQSKAKLFQSMLIGYSVFLRAVATQLIGEGKFPIQGHSLDYYLKVSERLLQKEIMATSQGDLSAILTPSRSFNVLAAALGSGTMFSRHHPETLEDVFTLLHQNLNACCSKLFVENISFHEISLPHLFKECEEELSKFRRKQLLGINLNSKQLTLRYNAPLRSHSSTFQIVFKENKAFLSVQLLGQTRSRWTLANHYLQILDTLNIQKLDRQPYQNGDVLNFTWALSDREEIASALTILNIVYEFTLHQDFDPLFRDIQEHIHRCYPQNTQQVFERLLDKVATILASMNGNGIYHIEIEETWTKLLNTFIANGEYIEKLTAIALHFTSLPDYNSKAIGSKILENLLNKSAPIFDEVLNVVDRFFQDGSEMQQQAAGLIRIFLRKRQKLAEIVSMVRNRLDFKDEESFQLLKTFWVRLKLHPNRDFLSKDLTRDEKLELFLHAEALILQETDDHQPMWTMIQNLQNDPDVLIRQRVLQLLISLVRTPKDKKQIIDLAKKYSQDSSPVIRKYTVNLFAELVRTGEPVSLELMKPLLFDSEPTVKKEIVALLANLIKADYDPEIILAAIKSFPAERSTDSVLQLIELIKRGHLVRECLNFAQTIPMDTTTEMSFIRLFKNLLDNGEYYPEMALFIHQFAKSKDLFNQAELFELFSRLVDKGYMLEEAFQYANQILHDQSSFNRIPAIKFLEKLAELPQIRKSIFSLINAFALKDENRSVQFEAFTFMKSLAETDLTIEERISFFTNFLIACEDKVDAMFVVCDFFPELIKQEKFLDEIIEACEKIIQSKKELPAVHAFLCLENIAKRNHAKDHIIAIIKKAKLSDDGLSVFLDKILAGIA